MSNLEQPNPYAFPTAIDFALRHPDDREHELECVLSDLVRKGTLHPEQATRVLNAFRRSPERRP